MQQADKVGIIGSGHSASLNAALTVAQEVERVEIQNRRRLMEKVIERHQAEKPFIKYMQLTSKQLKKQSKGFGLIHRYIDGLGLDRFHANPKLVLTPTQAQRISTMLNSMINSKIFAALDLEDITTDYSDLLIGLYITMKDVTANFMKRYPNHKGIGQLTYVSSEIGLRLYSLYVDDRIESVMKDYEEVRLR